MDLESYLRVFSGLAESRSRIYGLLSQLYLQPPDSDFLRELFSQDFEELLSSLLEQPSILGELKEGLLLLRKFVSEKREASFEETMETLTREREKLFTGAFQGEENLRVEKAYREMGVRLPEGAAEPPSHLGFKLDFMRFLCLREAEAWRSGSLEEAVNLLEKERDFLSKHLEGWVSGFCEEMFRRAEVDLYRGLAKLTKGFVEQDGLLLEEILKG